MHQRGGWLIVAMAVPSAAAQQTMEPMRSTDPPTRPSEIGIFGDVGPSPARALEPEQSAPGSLLRVTVGSVGADFDPHISADGTVLAFASTQHRATADIYSKRVGSNVVTQLTSDPGEDVMPAISPDGTRIAFASDRTGSWDIWVMPAAGGKAVQITSDPAHELHPSWSPDGTHLVFCRLGESSGRWELWVLEVQQPQVAHFIGHGLFPEWCPTGGTGLDGADRILFQRSRERGDRGFAVWMIDYAEGQSGSPTQIAASEKAAFVNPTWSPDGRHVVFASIEHVTERPEASGGSGEWGAARADLWMVAVDGTGLVNLTSGGARDLMPTWSKDHRIYFASARGSSENIWSTDARPALHAAAGDMANPNAFATAPSD